MYPFTHLSLPHDVISSSQHPGSGLYCDHMAFPSPGRRAEEAPHTRVDWFSAGSSAELASVCLTMAQSNKPASSLSSRLFPCRTCNRIDPSIKNVASSAAFTLLKRFLEMLWEVFSARCRVSMASAKVPVGQIVSPPRCSPERLS